MTSVAQLETERSSEKTPGSVFAELRERRGGRVELACEAAQLGGLHEAAQLLGERQQRVDRRAERAHARPRALREAAHVGERGAQLVERGRRGAQRPRQLADGGGQRALAVGERARRRVEVDDERAQLDRIGVEGAGHDALVADPVAEVARLLAEQRLGDDRRELVGGGLVLQRVVERLGAARVLRLSRPRRRPSRGRCACRTSARSSTWSNWTGVVVREAGIVAPSSSSARARASRATRSTKKLPSRKIRGRIFAAAFARTGRPRSRIAIVTVADCEPGLVCSTDVTSPTSTPAIRTGECGLMPGRVAERRLDLVGLVDERDVLGEREVRHEQREREQRRADGERGSVRARVSWQHRGSDPGRLGGEGLALGDARAALVRRALVARRAAVRVDPVGVAALAALAVGVAVLVDGPRVVGLVQLGRVAEQRVLDRVDRRRPPPARTAPKLSIEFSCSSGASLTCTRSVLPVVSSSERWSARNVQPYVK